MSNTDRLSDIRGLLQYAASGLLILVLYWIGQQQYDNTAYFLLSLLALLLGTPLLLSLYTVPDGNRVPLWLRIGIAFIVSLAGIVLTTVVAQLVPDPPHLAPIIFGVVLVMSVYLKSR